ncbi:DUF523 domain-containing protein [Cellulosilyticum sp. I15G10I2]|uniref:DUF523 domain-containing protein n=1 Tax=Cellulosilyticum sp. I15G10I2 TaxID=1892843 RepID=UPI00085CA7BE|nr:DUF523 domain-containing protein [Cellulosilyticum sp. I15G10I2]
MYLVSACLVGVKCRYDGKNVSDTALEELFQSGQAIPVCPELLGGLSCPRECSEIIQTDKAAYKVASKTNKDVTAGFKLGAKKTLEICQSLDITTAILKSKSPSCGYGYIYDGTFSGNMIEGNGLTAELLSQNNIKVLNELNWNS